MRRSGEGQLSSHDREDAAGATAAGNAGPAVALVWRPGCASCAAAKEFLTVNGIPFLSINPVEADGAARWAALGSPRIPSLVLDGRATAIYHTSQVASLLGLTPADRGDALRLAWDLAVVVEAWSDLLSAIAWELMVAPTPSRGRSIRNLTVNVHEPLREMAVARETGRFTWDTDLDEGRAERLGDADAVRAYAQERFAAWVAFLMDLGDKLAERDPQVHASGETMSFSSLLDAQRFHAAFHYRQLVTFLASARAAPAHQLELARFEGLRLPAAVY